MRQSIVGVGQMARAMPRLPLTPLMLDGRTPLLGWVTREGIMPAARATWREQRDGQAGIAPAPMADAHRSEHRV